jgi:hypothetical protein
MDVRLLKMFISAMQGGTLPDLKAEVSWRAHRDILIDWSRKVVQAAAPLAVYVPRDKWTLYTQLRPLFITADDPEQAALSTERFFTAHGLEEVINLFREEVARLDPERADAVIDAAQRDTTPSVLTRQSSDEIAANLRAYLLFERRQLEAAVSGSADVQLRDLARKLTWRTCHLLANLTPGWHTGSTSLTRLAGRRDIALAPLVADPRGMYSEIATKIPGLHEHLPYQLADGAQTGLCIPPKSVPAVADLLCAWLQRVEASPGADQPPAGELQAVCEAVIYARNHQTGLWEAAEMFVPARNLIPAILVDQGQREENPDAFAAKPVANATEEVTQLFNNTSEATASANGTVFKVPWYKKKLKW